VLLEDDRNGPEKAASHSVLRAILLEGVDAMTVCVTDAIRDGTNLRPYAKEWLYGLVARIVHEGDLGAREDLCQNRYPFFRNGQRLRLTDFVETLGDSASAWEFSGRNAVVLDLAKMLTVDKFSNLKGGNGPRNSQDGGCPGPEGECGPDARYYLGAVLRSVDATLRTRTGITRLEGDIAMERVFQAIVIKHFYLSCRECRRRFNRLATRYKWKTDRGAIVVQLPVEIDGAVRRQWLEGHIGEVNPSLPGERERVQELIDKAIATRRVVSLNAFDERFPDAVAQQDVTSFSLADGVSEDLVETVVEEKAATIHLQRPSIRALGPETLRHLIRQVFADLASEQYKPTEIAKSFGLSRPAMTRFAGSRWCKGNSDVIPDLFRNTAYVLAHHPAFEECAKAAGVWDRVTEIACAGQEGTYHD
jgi:hypothetical protein